MSILGVILLRFSNTRLDLFVFMEETQGLKKISEQNLDIKEAFDHLIF